MKQKNILMMTAVLFMGAIWGFIVLEKNTQLFKGLDLVVFILIVIFGVVALIKAIRAEKDIKAGIPLEDELSEQIKHKAGFLAFHYSMYMWLLIFILKDKFPNVETMLGGGILLSGLMFMFIHYGLKKKLNEK